MRGEVYKLGACVKIKEGSRLRSCQSRVGRSFTNLQLGSPALICC